jgi:hypothetical protein
LLRVRNPDGMSIFCCWIAETNKFVLATGKRGYQTFIKFPRPSFGNFATLTLEKKDVFISVSNPWSLEARQNLQLYLQVDFIHLYLEGFKRRKVTYKPVRHIVLLTALHTCFILGGSRFRFLSVRPDIRADGLSCISSALPGVCCDSTLKKVMTATFHIVSYSPFTVVLFSFGVV